MKAATLTLGFVGAISGLPVARQLDMAKRAGCNKVWQREESTTADVRARWMAHMKPGDTAWVPDLRVLVAPKNIRGKVRSTTDFHVTLRKIEAKGVVVVEDRTGLRSCAPPGSDERTKAAVKAAWIDRIDWISARIWSIHRKQVQVSKAMRRAREAKPIGIVTQWRSASMKAERERVAAIYFDKRHPNREAAVAALPEPLCHLSVVSAWRIFRDLKNVAPPPQETTWKPPKRRKKSKR